MNEEIKSILKIVENGKITAEEGTKLISSLEGNSIKGDNSQSSKKFLKIEVYSNDEDKTKVNIKIPLGLARVVLKMESIKNQINVNSNGMDIDFNDIIDLIENNADGELVNIESENNKVRIWIE